MGAFTKNEVLTLALPDSIPEGMPYVFDDHSLAFSLGIRNKTLWWLLLSNTIRKIEQDKGLYKEFKIPKRGNSKKFRTINEPCPALKNVQKSLLVTYFNHLPAPAHIGAYVQGRGLVHTAEQHVGNPVKISLDIKDFFPSTRRKWVRDWLRSFGYNDWVVKALSNLMVMPRRHNGSVVSGLPQGAPTSSLVSNFVADARVDQPVLRYLRSLDVESTYTRYADDIEVSFEKDLPFEVVDTITRKLTDVIHASGYRVNTRKTDVQREASPTRPMRVLGMTVNEKVNIPSEEYRRLRAIIHNCRTKGFETQYERGGHRCEVSLCSHLMGKLVYWREVNPEKINPLLTELRQAMKDQFGDYSVP